MVSFKFLLVDDEKPFIEAVARRLRHRGFNVDCAFSGTDALKRLEADDTFDIVLLDVKMPDMDGIETVKTIKKKYPLIEVIMLTGHATVSSAVGAIKFGAFDYLTKPCDLDDIIKKAKNAATRKKEREARLLAARTRPYITERERRELITAILDA